MKVSVIIPAAGLGTRMGHSPGAAPSRKQLMLLGDTPVLIHTIRKFAACPSVAEILVAVRPDDRPAVDDQIKRAGITKPIAVVVGGDSRQESVQHALAAVSSQADLVAVHDAVRPFIDTATIENAFATAAETGAAIVGIVPVDTVKQVKGHKIRQTLIRDHLVLAQTPQVFRTELLKEAFARAAAENFNGTDEASLVERLEKVEVTVVPGSPRNIKITKPSDLDLARYYYSLEASPAAAQ
jgi:2-C-methyl-D-erythritol 4-phosphate cytidylyltransferase